MKNCGSNGAVYGLGMLGSLVYFVQQSNGLSELVVGVIKAILWPGVLAHALLTYLQM
jgi:hypothetical protein